MFVNNFNFEGQDAYENMLLMTNTALHNKIISL